MSEVESLVRVLSVLRVELFLVDSHSSRDEERYGEQSDSQEPVEQYQRRVGLCERVSGGIVRSLGLFLEGK